MMIKIPKFFRPKESKESHLRLTHMPRMWTGIEDGKDIWENECLFFQSFTNIARLERHLSVHQQHVNKDKK